MLILIYRAMLLCRARGYATVSRSSVCSSVRPSVTFRYVFHTGWNRPTSIIISWLISLMCRLGLTPALAIWSSGNIPKIRVEYGEVIKTHAISLKRCKIRPRLLCRTNTKSHTRFRFESRTIAVKTARCRCKLRFVRTEIYSGIARSSLRQRGFLAWFITYR